jgi:hypothetical protein
LRESTWSECTEFLSAAVLVQAKITIFDNIPVAVTPMKINGYEFEHGCDIAPAREADTSVQRFMPQNRYRNERNLALNRYGAGPFCKFKISSRFCASGVYVLTIDDDVRYVCECTNLSARFNAGECPASWAIASSM